MTAELNSVRFTPEGKYDVMAGQERIAAAQRQALDRAERVNQAITILRQDVRNDEDAVRCLHAISAGLMSTRPLAGSDLLDSIERLDSVADEIQWRYEK